MLTRYLALIGFLGLSVTWPGYAQDKELETLFQQHQVDGTLVLVPLKGEGWVHNRARAEQGFLPASTFKIPNTLIGLAEGVVKPGELSFRWDGEDKRLKRWNRDHTLKSAYEVSCVWCYQQIAAQVGGASYLEHLEKLGYGNQKTGPEVTRFWLDGDLRISASQQIKLLKAIYLNLLPYDQMLLTQLKGIMLEHQTSAYSLYAKTGWAMGEGFNYGWYVGYLEGHHGVWFFALNMEIKGSAQAKLRKQIVMEALALKGLLPSV